MGTKRHYFKELRLQQLRAIVELSRGNGFAGAAAALKLTTPSVWQQVRSLEREFGTSLVEVIGLQVTLTDRGRLLVDLALPVVQGFDSILELFGEQSQAIPSRLQIAAPSRGADRADHRYAQQFASGGARRRCDDQYAARRCRLIELTYDPRVVGTGIEVLRNHPTLKRIVLQSNVTLPVAEFWKRYDAGEYRAKPK